MPSQAGRLSGIILSITLPPRTIVCLRSGDFTGSIAAKPVRLQKTIPQAGLRVEAAETAEGARFFVRGLVDPSPARLGRSRARKGRAGSGRACLQVHARNRRSECIAQSGRVRHQ